MTMQRGGICHCGIVRFSFEAEAIVEAMRCDCPVYRRKAGYPTLIRDQFPVSVARRMASSAFSVSPSI